MSRNSVVKSFIKSGCIHLIEIGNRQECADDIPSHTMETRIRIIDRKRLMLVVVSVCQICLSDSSTQRSRRGQQSDVDAPMLRHSY